MRFAGSEAAQSPQQEKEEKEQWTKRAIQLLEGHKAIQSLEGYKTALAQYGRIERWVKFMCHEVAHGVNALSMPQRKWHMAMWQIARLVVENQIGAENWMHLVMGFLLANRGQGLDGVDDTAKRRFTVCLVFACLKWAKPRWDQWNTKRR